MELHGFGHLLISGTWVTLQLALVSLPFGLIFGLLGVSAKLSSVLPLRAIGTLYTVLIRGVPELLLVLIFYYGTSMFLNWFFGRFVEVGPFKAGVLALSLAFGAYATEVFRSAMQEIPKGQREAALAIGMRPWAIFWHIELPQLWRIAIPGLGNLFLVLLKDTSLVSVVTLNELMRQASVAANSTGESFTFYMAAALIYLTLTIISMQVTRWLERRANRGFEEART